MPGKSFTLDVNPAVLRWARESAGFEVEDAAQSLRQPESVLASWEAGRKKPNWTVLRQLASLYKRPVASLLLPAPPEEPPLPPDFRTLPNAQRKLSPKTRFAIRMARWFLQTAGELRHQLAIKPELGEPRVRWSDNPETGARRARESFGVTVADQVEWPTQRHAFNQWRGALEARGTFVFQFPLPLEEVRGLALTEDGVSGIVLNQSDAVSARIFTLFHEYAHLLLAAPGICLPEEAAGVGSPHIETFCNRFAAAFLVPGNDLEEQLSEAPDDQTIRALAGRYRVSRYVVLGRMRTLGAISVSSHRKLFLRWQRQAEGVSRPPRPQQGGLSAVARCLSERGRPFVSLVIQAARRELITMNDAAAYLGTKLDSFGKLEAKVA